MAVDYAAIARSVLLADAQFAALVAPARVALRRAPPSVTNLFVIVQAQDRPVDGAGVMWRPRIQVDAYAPQSDTAEDEVHAIADRAALVLGRVRNHIVGEVSVSGRHTDGPIRDWDTSRGDDAPLARCMVAALFTVHRRF